jgi:D-alanyl-D-alanine-carboxypeptidase/D-alanyl-D-alanine-endopeptidase
VSDPFVQPPVPSDATIRRLLAHRLDDCQLSVGMAVGITDAKSHRVVAYGRCDNDSRRAVSENTIFEIGSITKLFTALLLSDMANRGEVELTEPVGKLLPAGVQIPERNGRSITLRDLASHHSGLPRLPTNLEPNDRQDPYAHYTAEHLYAFLANHQLTRTPGDTFEYSNVGVGLLGHALGLRAGAPYTSLVHDRILAPLGMNDTAIVVPSRLSDLVAKGHDANLDPVSDWHLGILEGAGALRSNVSDLLLFLDALNDPVSPLGPMMTPLVTPRDRGGLELGPLHPDGGVALSHAGGTGGFRSFVRCIPQWRRGVVVLSNSAIDAVVDLGVHLLDSRMGMHWYRKEAVVDPRIFARLVGRYQLRPNHVFEVTSSAGQLYAQLTGQPAFRLFPTSEWHFSTRSSVPR